MKLQYTEENITKHFGQKYYCIAQVSLKPVGIDHNHDLPH